MSIDKLTDILNTMASDLMLLDGSEIDIPSAGRYFNYLEDIIDLAKEQKIEVIKITGNSLIKVLEKIVLGSLRDSSAGAGLLERGISLMQRAAHDYKHKGETEVTAEGFMKEMADMVGMPEAKTIYLDDHLEKGGPDFNETETRETSVSDEVNIIQEKKTANEQAVDDSLMKDFVVESMEYINEIEINILNLEKNTSDKNCINAIFRPFHSIKGVASFLNLDEIRELAHNLENLLDQARNEEIEITPDIIDLILDGADVLKGMIGNLKKRIEGQSPETADLDVTDIYRRIQEVEQTKGFMPTSIKLGEILIDSGVISGETLGEALRKKEETPTKKLGEVLIDEGMATHKQVTKALRKQAERISDLSAIRVDTRKLDDLIDMVGELVITQSMIQQDLKNQVNVDRNLARDLAQYARITSGLQRLSTSLRMVPIKQTFQRMSRLVRDLAKNAGKSIDIILIGEDTEIDRNMVDEIYNPLVHMVRNSVDHGIELPEDRERAGKAITGTIRLKAYHRGGSVIIEISDDGRGLNKDKILKKALLNGQLQNAEELTDQEIYRLIFLPGLSTAEKVTNVSGRGVGMDVVKQAVEKLRGNVDIDSQWGKGTTFTTRFPLTMAIIDGIIINVGDERFIMPTSSIKKILQPTVNSCSKVAGQVDMIKVMENLYPLVRLYELFSISPAYTNPWEGIIIVLESGGRAKCLMVDQIISRTEVVIKSLGDGVQNIKGISGGAILGDGKIGLILDPEGIFELSEGGKTVSLRLN